MNKKKFVNKHFRQVIKDNITLMYTYIYDDKLKNIIAKINDVNEVFVKAPSYITVEMLDQFILSNFSKLTNFIDKKKSNSLINFNENKISLLGKPYQLVTKIIDKGNEKYEIINNKIYLFLKSEENIKKIVYKMLNQLGENYLLKKAQTLAIKFYKAFEVKPSSFKTKWYESKWGQCDCNSKEITLAIQLYMLNEHIINYVIIHELCHLIYPNHSKDFWKLVESICPNYKYIQEKLKFEC